MTSDGEVFFNKTGAARFAITIDAPRTGTYEVTLEGKPGSYYFHPSKISLCNQPNITNAGSTNSFRLCTSATNGCRDFHLGTTNEYHYPTSQFDLQAGVNTLWLKNRELCALARQLSIEALQPSPPSPPAPPAPPPPPPSPLAPPPWDVVALADVAPTNDPDVGVTSDGEVFFNKTGAARFAITIDAPRTGTYEVTLEGKPGSYYFHPSKISLCNQPNITNAGSTNSFRSVHDQRPTACRRLPSSGTGERVPLPNPRQFDLQAGENTLWLKKRERCALARQLTITPTQSPPPSPPAPPAPPPPPPSPLAPPPWGRGRSRGRRAHERSRM